MTKSKKTSKGHQKFDYGMEPKITTLLSIYAFRSLLCIRFVSVAFRSEEVFVTYFSPALVLEKTATLIRDLEYLIHTKFIKIHQAVLEGSRKCKASVTKRRGIGPIRAEISPYKIRKKLFIFRLLALTALVSGKITSVYCQILEILGQKRHFFAI